MERPRTRNSLRSFQYGASRPRKNLNLENPRLGFTGRESASSKYSVIGCLYLLSKLFVSELYAKIRTRFQKSPREAKIGSKAIKRSKNYTCYL